MTVADRARANGLALDAIRGAYPRLLDHLGVTRTESGCNGVTVYGLDRYGVAIVCVFLHPDGYVLDVRRIYG